MTAFTTEEQVRKMRKKIGSLFTLAGYSLVIVHFINRYVSIHADYKDILPSYHNHFYNWNLGRVYYTVRGKGDPLLLLHDVTSGASGYEWNRVEEELSQDYTVYTVDLPGCGRSDKENQIYTNFVFVQFVTSFLRDVIKEKPSVLASGYGCSIAVMASHYKENLFDKVVLINPEKPQALRKPVTPRGKLYYSIIRTPVLGTFIYHLHVSRETITTRFMNEYFSNPFKIDRDLVDAYYEAAHKGAYNSKFIHASAHAGYLHVNLQEAISSLPADTLIIRGEEEPGGASADASYIGKAPSIQRLVIKGTKHLPHLEKPDRVLRAVKNFLDH